MKISLINYLEKNSENYKKLIEHSKNNFILQNRINRIMFIPQFGFAFLYSTFFLKLILFNHYNKYNKTIKILLAIFYQNTIDLLTFVAGNIEK